MDTSHPLHDYILSQIQAGLTSQDIATQLHHAGWDEASIRAGFESVAQTLSAVASPAITETPQSDIPATGTLHETTTDPTGDPAAVSPQTLPAPLARSRIKIGWLLFKQSLKIIKQFPGLISYVIASLLVTLAIELVFVVIIILDSSLWHVITANNLLFYVVIYIGTFILTFAAYFFATALSAHVLAIFEGRTSTYHENIAVARTKIGTIAGYALITTTVGFILRMLEERFRLIGWIISKILGALWTLATVFTLPIIADTDKSSIAAVKESLHLFKANWGQTIVGRVAVGGLAFLLFIVIMVPVAIIFSLIFFPFIGVLAPLLALVFFVLGVVALSTVITLATNILNVCLYYYAQYHAVPPAFDPALLASVFVQKKRKRQS